MSDTHPILTNILSLADQATWQHSVDLGGETVSTWLGGLQGREIRRICFLGCGTSYYAGQVAKYVVEQIAHIPAEAMQAYAFATYEEPAVLGPQVLVAGISATGESEAVRDALAHANQSDALTLAITANADSSVAREANGLVLTGGEDDKTLVKTKSYVQSLVAVYLLALGLARTQGIGGAELVAYWRDQIARASEGVRRFLDQQRPEIEQLVETYAVAEMVFMLGSGPNAGTIEEASLKVIEMAKMYSEAQELEDFLHGRFREVDQVNPMFFVAPQGRSSRRILDVLTITDRVGAPSVVLTDQITPGIQRLATQVVEMPVHLDELATPLLYITPLHLFAYHMAGRRGWDPLSRRYEDIVPQKVRYSDPEA